MLPIVPLAIFFVVYLVLATAAGISVHALTQLRRIAVFLCVLFVLDWLFIGPGFAFLITLRLALLVTAFTIVTATTTPDEVRVALERVWVPPRFAFVFATAYSAIGLLESEVHGIIEAQQARGISLSLPSRRCWREWRRYAANLVALLVPALVLVTQRAWSVSEAAIMRGLESPHPRRHRASNLGWVDGALLGGTAFFLTFLLFAC